MPKAELESTLQALREELDSPGAIDAETRRQLEEVRDEIAEALELTSESRRERHPALQARIVHSLEAFGAEHPSLSRALSALLDTLTGLGL